ncbi:nucleoporin GLE1-like [Gigantopelta aegis]|uniref:nucleoporin GLE1-like n=1 Tax=Gigantopelta aegis TaxID=1735272 RepID=UPI001B8874AD|nr:nucleoporin GLE1-like [Gigantopelta aegis]
MEIGKQLKNSSKGKLIYKTNPRNIKEILDDAASPYQLQHSHLERPTHVQGNKLYEDKKDIVATDKSKKQAAEKSQSDEKLVSKEKKTKYSCVSLITLDSLASGSKSEKTVVSPEFGRTVCMIKECERMWDNKAKAAAQAKQEAFNEKTKRLHQSSQQKLQEQEENFTNRMKQLYEQTSQLHKKEMAETVRNVTKLKEDHSTHSKRLDDKLQEGDRKRREIAEEERKRQEEMQTRQISMQKVHSELKTMIEQFHNAYNGCAYKQYFGDLVNKSVNLMKQIKETADLIINRKDPSEDLSEKLSNILDRAKNAYDCLKQHIDEANKKGKAEDEARQKLAEQEAQIREAQASNTAPEPVQEQQPSATASVNSVKDEETGQTTPRSPEEKRKRSVIEEVVKDFIESRMHVNEVDKTLANFVNNSQMKKYKFSLQKAVNVPVNAIAPQSGTHLRSQIQKLLHLLSGSQVEVSGKHVSAKEVPEGLLFCKHLIAKMIVKKAEEQVTSNHESAFSIAMVAVGLWQEHADLGKMLLHHFYVSCPYIIPYYMPRQDGMTLEQYHRVLGYKVEGGSIEAQDKFLKRMSGLMRLYAAILISSPPKTNQPHPHGIEHAWIWLTRILNMDPQPDITATMTFDLLQVTGHDLFGNYKMQFVKLVYLLYKDLLPKMKNIAATGGPVARLENFLETLLKNLKNRMAPQQPDGYLPPGFWFS